MEHILKTAVLRVHQPIGEFYLAVIPARILLDVTFSDRLKASYDDEVSYRLDGTQREKKLTRQHEIGAYIQRLDAAFPNAIILAANSDPESGRTSSEMVGDDGKSEDAADFNWRIEQEDGRDMLIIPSRRALAAIIDGQHRLDGFKEAGSPSIDMELPCSIFMDLPKPFQAQIFATINSTQKQVDRSLTYELFGYNIAEEPEERWSPDKFAVFLMRRLNTLEDSPLRGRVWIAPKRDTELARMNEERDWHVASATVVDGILRLISSNPKADTNYLMSAISRTRLSLRNAARKDRSPLRELYLAGQDKTLYAMLLNYLRVCDELFWSKAPPGSYIVKTIGVQALFDVLRPLSAEAIAEKDATADFFRRRLEPAAEIDFAAADLRNASGAGRSAIRKKILETIG
jgi:DNA phosphorothioation-associated DGQHR protein 1